MIDFKKQIDEIFDGLIKDMADLVSVNSVLDLDTAKENQPFGKANREVLDKMLAIGKRDGYEVKDVDGYAGHIDIGEGEETVAILGHLDVVPVNPTGWDSDPFTLTKIENKYYGRGTSDDKGPLLAAYYAAKLVEASGAKMNKKIRVIFGCNEESGSKCLRYYFSKEPYCTMGFTPDANFPVVYGEKKGVGFSITGHVENNKLISLNAGTVANIVPESATALVKGKKEDYEEAFNAFLNKYGLKGTIEEKDEVCSIELIGKSSHASLPHLGKNAVCYLAGFLNTVIDHPVTKFLTDYFFEDYLAQKIGFGFTGQMGPLTLNVGIVHYNDQDLSIRLDIRAPHELDEEKMLETMHQVLTPYQFKEEHYIGSHLFVDPNSVLIQGLHQAYVDCTKDQSASPQAIGGGTYAKMMPNCVAFGPEFPGTDNQIHQNNEFVDIDELKLSIEIYANALYNLVTK